MDIRGKNILVLGGAGMVGVAVCRQLLPHAPARLLVAARRKQRAQAALEELRADPGFGDTKVEAVWGDVLLRTACQPRGGRAEVLSDPDARRRMIADMLEPLSASIADASLLVRLITKGGKEGVAAHIVVDCMNTATALSYQNLYATATRVVGLATNADATADWSSEVENLAAALQVPQLVRHIQLLHEGMRRAATDAYIKVGTSGTGGMGFNIPYTHGEEKPSRLLLSKAALAGAQTALTFLMARTPAGPSVVKELKPAALIAWRDVGCGEVTDHGHSVPLYDCSLQEAASLREPDSLVPQGDFGHAADGVLRGVYIDTGENGLYSADEFATITALGQMQIVTPEEIARDLVRELRGQATGRDVVTALDASITGPSFRGGYLRSTALSRLRELEAEHGPSVAFEQLGPPRLSKLLFEAHLLRAATQRLEVVLASDPRSLASLLADVVTRDAGLRQRILSIGIAILLPDGERLLRGPRLKARDAHHGFVDLTAENMARWQGRLARLRLQCATQRAAEASSRPERALDAGRPSGAEPAFFEPSDLAFFVLDEEESGHRHK